MVWLLPMALPPFLHRPFVTLPGLSPSPASLLLVPWIAPSSTIPPTTHRHLRGRQSVLLFSSTYPSVATQYLYLRIRIDWTIVIATPISNLSLTPLHCSGLTHSRNQLPLPGYVIQSIWRILCRRATKVRTLFPCSLRCLEAIELPMRLQSDFVTSIPLLPILEARIAYTHDYKPIWSQPSTPSICRTTTCLVVVLAILRKRRPRLCAMEDGQRVFPTTHLWRPPRMGHFNVLVASNTQNDERGSNDDTPKPPRKTLVDSASSSSGHSSSCGGGF